MDGTTEFNTEVVLASKHFRVHPGPKRVTARLGPFFGPCQGLNDFESAHSAIQAQVFHVVNTFLKSKKPAHHFW